MAKLDGSYLAGAIGGGICGALIGWYFCDMNFAVALVASTVGATLTSAATNVVCGRPLFAEEVP